ncbi:MAG: biopolymer transporter ExbD [Bacteroidetes bacterium HGW-Bacteroidetes-17]|jgi:biopolymer transport protein ExbD|nr:MAG: biopolymer transporter ExbD [Bacteroidetes bacterium HGW-Bacteroidetes-17]
MSRFKKEGSKDVPAISTSSMPDIIFMLLFFFMVTTTMKQTTVMVRNTLPQASEVEKLEKKSLVSFIHVGPPQNKAVYGTEPRIQLNDRFALVSEIQEFVTLERDARDEVDRKFITTSLKIHNETKMGLVSDIKQELRKAGAFKINYSTRKLVGRK